MGKIRNGRERKKQRKRRNRNRERKIKDKEGEKKENSKYFMQAISSLWYSVNWVITTWKQAKTINI